MGGNGMVCEHVGCCQRDDCMEPKQYRCRAAYAPVMQLA